MEKTWLKINRCWSLCQSWWNCQGYLSNIYESAEKKNLYGLEEGEGDQERPKEEQQWYGIAKLDDCRDRCFEQDEVERSIPPLCSSRTKEDR